MRNGKAAGVDELLMDITRSRDAGNAPYRNFFKRCSLPKIRKWKDLRPYFDDINYMLLRKFYKNVADIDLMVGVLLEKRCETQAGPIATCIISEQFYRFRYGDRFFYSNENRPYPFTKRL